MTLQSSLRLVVSPSPLSRGLSIQDGAWMRRPHGAVELPGASAPR